MEQESVFTLFFVFDIFNIFLVLWPGSFFAVVANVLLLRFKFDRKDYFSDFLSKTKPQTFSVFLEKIMLQGEKIICYCLAGWWDYLKFLFKERQIKKKVNDFFLFSVFLKHLMNIAFSFSKLLKMLRVWSVLWQNFCVLWFF